MLLGELVRGLQHLEVFVAQLIEFLILILDSLCLVIRQLGAFLLGQRRGIFGLLCIELSGGFADDSLTLSIGRIGTELCEVVSDRSRSFGLVHRRGSALHRICQEIVILLFALESTDHLLESLLLLLRVLSILGIDHRRPALRRCILRRCR